MNKTVCDLCGKVVKQIDVQHPNKKGEMIELSVDADAFEKSTGDRTGSMDICKACLKTLL